MLSTQQVSERGFTVIELVISIGIMAIVMAGVCAGGIVWYQRVIVRANQLSVVMVLSLARAQALFGVRAEAHGVHFEGSIYSSFSGSHFDASNHDVDRRTFDPGISSATPQSVIFLQGSGTVAEPSQIVLRSQFGTVVRIEVNSEGVIAW